MLVTLPTYGLETFALRGAMQRAIKIKMIEVILREKMRNEDARKRAKVKDIVERIAQLKWQRTGKF